MNDSKFSFTGALKVLACIIFDIALILAYFRAFRLFIIIAPVKSILILFVLIVGLIVFNAAVAFPSMVFKNIGIPYSVSIITLFVLYSIIANILSIFLIQGSTILYMVCELVIFATFILVLSIIIVFSKGEVRDINKVKREQVDKNLILLQLQKIEDLFTEKENQEAILHCMTLFKSLKERIQASTPFGRLDDNSSVLEIENQIKNNLISLEIGLQSNLDGRNLLEIQKLIEDTKRLVINRETLNVK